MHARTVAIHAQQKPAPRRGGRDSERDTRAVDGNIQLTGIRAIGDHAQVLAAHQTGYISRGDDLA